MSKRIYFNYYETCHLTKYFRQLHLPHLLTQKLWWIWDIERSLWRAAQLSTENILCVRKNISLQKKIGGTQKKTLSRAISISVSKALILKPSFKNVFAGARSAINLILRAQCTSFIWRKNTVRIKRNLNVKIAKEISLLGQD